jgi:hypothetical protein
MSPRLWLLAILALAGALAPSRVDARGVETCAQGFLATATTVRPESEPQVAGTHQGFAACGYESASGYSHAAESETMTTVLGSGRDVAAYAGKPGFNVLDMSSVPEQEWARTNAEWLNSAMQRGDNIWLVTDPAAHAQLMQQLGKSSYYLDLELPMLEEFNASPVIKYAVPPGH